MYFEMFGIDDIIIFNMMSFQFDYIKYIFLHIIEGYTFKCKFKISEINTQNNNLKIAFQILQFIDKIRWRFNNESTNYQ